MSVLTRLKKIEKKVHATYADNALEKELLQWLDLQPYTVGSSFHKWCDKMPKHLIKPFANYIKKNICFHTLNELKG
jgi:hypothetical protein